MEGSGTGLLALEPNSGDPRQRNRQKKDEADSKPKTFQQEYDFESYVNKDNDSDLEEDEIFNSLNNHESDGAQNVFSVSNNQRKPKKPEVLKEK